MNPRFEAGHMRNGGGMFPNKQRPWKCIIEGCKECGVSPSKRLYCDEHKRVVKNRLAKESHARAKKARKAS